MSLREDDNVIKEIKAQGLEYLFYDGNLYAIVLRDDYKGNSVRFFTPDSFSQQLGYLPHKKGDIIKSHEHRIDEKTMTYTQEVLVVKEGKVKINFFDKDHRQVLSAQLNTGDVVLLVSGGHGFEFLENTIMIEIKQGPYTGANDKVIFEETKITDDPSK
jgi:hypothetical protein